jgi:hypothetical protein
MALDQWRAMTDDQLLDLAHQLTPGTPDDVAVSRILHLRVAQREAQGGAALVKATDRLVRITGRLGTATWVLGGMTLLLVLAAGVQAYPIFKREDVGQRIRRECVAIMREAAAVAPRGEVTDQEFNDAVFTCLVTSATKGRQ